MKEPRRKIALARHLRKTMTEPERLHWARIKDRSEGIIFKRQRPIGPYVLDFFCYKAQLAVEIDGGQHDADKDVEGMPIFSRSGLKRIAFRQMRCIATPMPRRMVLSSLQMRRLTSGSNPTTAPHSLRPLASTPSSGPPPQQVGRSKKVSTFRS